jgi:hypothetical protein
MIDCLLHLLTVLTYCTYLYCNIQPSQAEESLTQNPTQVDIFFEEPPPWGRLMPKVPGQAPWDLAGSDKEYVLGRSHKCDIAAWKPPNDRARQQWAHGMISNRHCRIFCFNSNYSNKKQVLLQDSSGNGTLVNGQLVRRGERRQLQSGDEICLVNPETLQKKVQSRQVLNELLAHHTYVFVEQQQQSQVRIMSCDELLLLLLSSERMLTA